MQTLAGFWDWYELCNFYYVKYRTNGLNPNFTMLDPITPWNFLKRPTIDGLGLKLINGCKFNKLIRFNH